MADNNVKVTTTVTCGSHTKTFDATASTTGALKWAAQGLINAVASDACSWTRDLAQEPVSEQTWLEDWIEAPK